jgi:hypothetical protein
MTMRNRMEILLAIVAIGSAVGAGPRMGAHATEPKVPIIYFTDLFHPAVDPDDHFDLATLFALKEFDVRAIILDNHADRPDKDQGNAGGRPALEQMMHITGRRVPWAIGLNGKLQTRDDKAFGGDAKWQGGIELMLSVLRKSREKVVIKLTSGCDFAAAFNREPELIKAKVKAVYLHAGNGPGGRQWEFNAQIDPVAYERVFESGVPVYWCPCFGRNGYQTHFVVPDQSTIFQRCAEPVQRFFAYAFAKSQDDPIAFLKNGSTALPKGRREMWSTPTLAHAAGREIYRRGDQYVLLTPADAVRAGLADKKMRLFEFVPARVTPTRSEGDATAAPGSLNVELNPPRPNVALFHQINREDYPRVMISCLENLLGELGR